MWEPNIFEFNITGPKNVGPNIGRSIPTSPQWKTIQSPQEKGHFVGSPQFVPTLAGKGVLWSYSNHDAA